MFERKVINDKVISKMLKYMGSKYYEVDYFISLFESDNISKILWILLKNPI